MRKTCPSGSAAYAVALSIVIVACLPQPASAKSLFESIFGFLGSETNQPAPQRVQRRPAGPRTGPVRFHNGVRRANPFQERQYRSRAVPVSRTGRYKTVCVRLCDGFYFPISNTSRRRDFYDDAQRCQSRCDSEARLFYMSSSTASIKGARDLRGIAYSKLKTAFLYRKKLKKGCACRPKPWTVGERLRHQTYALVAQDKLARSAGDIDDADGGTGVVAAKPALVGDGAAVATAAGRPGVLSTPVMARPVLAPRPPAPREVRYHRSAARGRSVRYVPRPKSVPRRPRRPIKKKSWGLGASFGGGNGLPKAKYRHRWPGQVD